MKCLTAYHTLTMTPSTRPLRSKEAVVRVSGSRGLTRHQHNLLLPPCHGRKNGNCRNLLGGPSVDFNDHPLPYQVLRRCSSSPCSVHLPLHITRSPALARPTLEWSHPVTPRQLAAYSPGAQRSSISYPASRSSTRTMSVALPPGLAPNSSSPPSLGISSTPPACSRTHVA